MGAASKYMLRQPSTEPVEPKRLSEVDALCIVVAATEGAACPRCEVGPLAAHLRGPVAALPAEGLPESADLRSAGHLRRPSAVADLLLRACGSGINRGRVQCRCDGSSRHPLAMELGHISPALVARVHHNTTATQVLLDFAFKSGDVDRLTHAYCPRLDALKMLADRCRAANGGDLPEMVVEALVVLLRTLSGPTRFDVRGGWEMIDWPPHFRVGEAHLIAQSVLVQDFIADRILIRLIEGR